MEQTFGGIELGGTFGGYEIINIPATKLPQDVASAISGINTTILGSTFNPLWYVGKQIVNGVNHLFIAEDIRATKDKDKRIVGLVINIPAGDGAFKGEGAKIERIIESEKLPADVEEAFLMVSKSILGVGYKSVMYLGKQTVKGENHFILCEAKTIYPYTNPFAAVMCINIFEGKPSLVSVAPVKGTAPIKDAGDGKAGLFGYAFTW